ncbi:MAG: hypothetical protein ACLPVY_26280 [Acidimicrobiia bacterium]|jgi:hypothetical protein
MGWEYIVVSKRMDSWIVSGWDGTEGASVLIDLLNRLGAEGWELVTAIGDPGQPRVYMKRPTS